MQVIGVNALRRVIVSIAEVVWAEAGEPGVVELVRRLVFNALIGNADMHMKNWSMLYPDGRNAMLAPAYDLLSTIAYLPGERMALNLVRSKRFADLTVAAFTHFAGKARLPEHPVLSAVRDTAGRFRDEWPAAKRELPVAERVARAIDAHLVVAAAAGLDADIASAGDQVSGHAAHPPQEGAGNGLPWKGFAASIRGRRERLRDLADAHRHVRLADRGGRERGEGQADGRAHPQPVGPVVARTAIRAGFTILFAGMRHRSSSVRPKWLNVSHSGTN